MRRIVEYAIVFTLASTLAWAGQVPNPVNAPSSIVSGDLYCGTNNPQQSADCGSQPMQAAGISGQVQANSNGFLAGLTNAALTALIDLFNSTTAGVVPASGGGTSDFLRADGAWAVPAQNLFVPSITGLLPSSITGTNTTGSLTVSVGSATDSTLATELSIGSPASWAVSNGDAINGYQGGTTLPDSSTIHFFLCSGGSGTGTFASTSESSPSCPTGYATYERRIFSLNTNSSGALLPGAAIEGAGGEEIFYLTTQVQDVNTTVGNSSRSLVTLSVPAGLIVQPLFRFISDSAGATFIITSGSETDVAPASSFGSAPGFDLDPQNSGEANPGYYGIPPFLTTNTSSQVGIRASQSSQQVYGYTRGWIDFRRN